MHAIVYESGVLIRQRDIYQYEDNNAYLSTYIYA